MVTDDLMLRSKKRQKRGNNWLKLKVPQTGKYQKDEINIEDSI